MFSKTKRLSGRRSASVNGSTNRRLIRRVLIASVVASLGLVIGAPMAHADPCAPLDLGCTLEDTTTTAGEVLEDTTTTAGEVLEDTTTTAGEVLEDTTTTVGEVVEETTTTAGGVLGGGAGPGALPGGTGVFPGTGGQPSGGGSGTPADPPVFPGEGSSGGGGGTHVGSPAIGNHTGSTHPVVGVGFDAAIPVGFGDGAGSAGRSHVRFSDDGSTMWQLSGAWLARTLAFPLLLLVLVFGFMLVQNRIDRRDPKLALAPVGADHLTFS
jgi:hypothetical protein